MRGAGPWHPPGQAVNGVPEGRLREGQLAVFATEEVAAAVVPVGPRGPQLAGAVRRELIRVEAGDKVGVAEPEAAQAATKLGDRRPVAACIDLVLCAPERARHGDQHTDPGRPAHRPVAASPAVRRKRIPLLSSNGKWHCRGEWQLCYASEEGEARFLGSCTRFPPTVLISSYSHIVRI